MCMKATQTIPHPSLLVFEQWAIINDQKHWSFRSASRSGCGTVSHHRGLKDFEFQTGNSLITLQKWSCEVWSWSWPPEQWKILEGNRNSLFRWISVRLPEKETEHWLWGLFIFALVPLARKSPADCCCTNSMLEVSDLTTTGGKIRCQRHLYHVL
mgnify:CR=1 FL=1